VTPAEIQRELEELETRLERLRIKYDQYFTGIEKMLPLVQRKDVDRRFALLNRVQMRNTGLRFRLQTLVQRFTMYQTYWQRIIRQIEEGTFRRDVVRAQRMGLGNPTRRAIDPDAPEELGADDIEELDALEPEPAPPATQDAVDSDPFTRSSGAAPMSTAATPTLSDDALEPPMVTRQPPPGSLEPPPARPLTAVPRVAPSLSPGNASTPPAAQPSQRPPLGQRPILRPPTVPSSIPAPTAPSTPPITPRSPQSSGEDSGIRQLYDRYVAARKETGENADIQYETVAKQVRETLPRLAEKYHGADVRLDVTIKDGKAILRPVVTMKKP
jgi:hypothetical protein